MPLASNVKKPLEMICQSRWQSGWTFEQSKVVVEAYLVQWNCFCDNLPNSRYEEDSSWVAVGGDKMVNKRLAGSCLSVSKGLLFAVLDRHCWLTAELTTYAERSNRLTLCVTFAYRSVCLSVDVCTKILNGLVLNLLLQAVVLEHKLLAEVK